MAEGGPIEEVVEALGDPRARPDVDWVMDLTGRPEAEVRTVLGELGGYRDLEESVRRTLRSGGRESYAQICAPFELYALVRLLAPEQIVETGVSSGISSMHFLLGIRRNQRGTLHSVDLPTAQRAAVAEPDESPVAIPPGRASGWAVPPELRPGWDLRLGSTQDRLPPLLRELDRVDLFLHDDLHTEEHLTWELELLRPKLRPGSVVLADNTDWTGHAIDRFASRYGVPVRTKRGRDLKGFRVPAP